MSQTKILSIIPESLHEDLFKEVAQVLAEKGKNNLSEVSPEIKAFIEKQKAKEKPSPAELEAVINHIM